MSKDTVSTMNILIYVRVPFGIRRLVFIITTEIVAVILYTYRMNTTSDILRGGMTMKFFEEQIMKETI